MAVTTQRVSTCLPEKSPLWWKLQFPLNRLKARLFTQRVEQRKLQPRQIWVSHAHRCFKPLSALHFESRLAIFLVADSAQWHSYTTARTQNCFSALRRRQGPAALGGEFGRTDDIALQQ
jgi:hypothetical protein